MSNRPQNVDEVMNEQEVKEEGTEGYACDAVPHDYRTHYWFYLWDNCLTIPDRERQTV